MRVHTRWSSKSSAARPVSGPNSARTLATENRPKASSTKRKNSGAKNSLLDGPRLCCIRNRDRGAAAAPSRAGARGPMLWNWYRRPSRYLTRPRSSACVKGVMRLGEPRDAHRRAHEELRQLGEHAAVAIRPPHATAFLGEAHVPESDVAFVAQAPGPGIHGDGAEVERCQARQVIARDLDDLLGRAGFFDKMV